MVEGLGEDGGEEREDEGEGGEGGEDQCRQRRAGPGLCGLLVLWTFCLTTKGVAYRWNECDRNVRDACHRDESGGDQSAVRWPEIQVQGPQVQLPCPVTVAN